MFKNGSSQKKNLITSRVFRKQTSGPYAQAFLSFELGSTWKKKKKLFNLQYSKHIRINSYGTFIIPVSFSFNVKLLHVFARSLTVPKTLVFICKLKLFFVFLQPGRQ